MNQAKFAMRLEPESTAQKRNTQVSQIALYSGITIHQARKVLEAIELGKIRSVRMN